MKGRVSEEEAEAFQGTVRAKPPEKCFPGNAWRNGQFKARREQG